MTGSLPVKSFSLAELMAKSPSMEWYEAVAICQALCDTLQLSGVADTPVHIGPAQVAIDASGSVHVGSTASEGGARAVDEVANLLRTLLPDQNVPTPLRLAMSQSSTAQSLEEWSRSVQYYERPNRAFLIRTVYQRAAQPTPNLGEVAARLSQAPVVAPAAMTEPSVAPPPPIAPRVPIPEPSPVFAQADTPKPQVPRPVPAIQRVLSRIEKRHIALGITAAAALLLATAAVSLVQANRGKSVGASAASVPAAVPAAPQQPESPAAPTALDRAVDKAASMMGSIVSRIPILGGEATELDEPPRDVRTGHWIHLPVDRAKLEPRSFIVMPVHRSVPILMPGPEADPQEALAVAPSVAITGKPLVSRAIYSADDDDVIPPVAVYPQFPSTYPPGLTQNDFAEFEVVVLPTGGVESVRARRVPATMAEAVRVTMSLSAAKTWRFQPGLKDGEPVKYLQVIRILKN